jgi:hypothetical protein
LFLWKNYMLIYPQEAHTLIKPKHLYFICNLLLTLEIDMHVLL